MLTGPSWSEIDVNDVAKSMAPKAVAGKPDGNGDKHDRDEDGESSDEEPLRKKRS